eukprot:gene320-411_t
MELMRKLGIIVANDQEAVEEANTEGGTSRFETQQTIVRERVKRSVENPERLLDWGQASMKFSILLSPEAYQDIQEGINYYNEQEGQQGFAFYQEVEKAFERLMVNPFFQIRYDSVRCFHVRQFPYMVHFTMSRVATKRSLLILGLFKLDPLKNDRSFYSLKSDPAEVQS